MIASLSSPSKTTFSAFCGAANTMSATLAAPLTVKTSGRVLNRSSLCEQFPHPTTLGLTLIPYSLVYIQLFYYDTEWYFHHPLLAHSRGKMSSNLSLALLLLGPAFLEGHQVSRGEILRCYYTFGCISRLNTPLGASV